MYDGPYFRARSRGLPPAGLHDELVSQVSVLLYEGLDAAAETYRSMGDAAPSPSIDDHVGIAIAKTLAENPPPSPVSRAF